MGKEGKPPITPQVAKRSLQRSLRLGTWLSLIGMAITLIGAEQIVGTLVAKVLYTQVRNMVQYSHVVPPFNG
jgi:hypothetical protein